VADQLQIVIGADTAPLQQGLNAAEKSVEKFDKTVKKTVTSSGQATLALSNLGRVASDAPFGFIAIANNIEPLIQSFQSLGKQSGGTGGALKALAGSLVGPGGLLLGVSLVSSAVTVAVQKYGSLGKAIDALFGNYTQLDAQVLKSAKSYDKFNESLRTTQEIADQEEAGTRGQIVRVKALAAIVGDQTKSYNERNSALRSLSEINKTYFGDLRIENGLVVNLDQAVQNYTKSIIDSARAKGFEAEIGKTAVQLREQERLLEALRIKRDEITKQPFKIVGAAAVRSNAGEIQDANNAYEKQRIVVQNLRNVLTDFENQLKTYTGSIVNERIQTDAAAEAARLKLEAEKAADKQRQRNIQSAKEAQEAEDRLNKILEIQRKLRNAPTAVALDPAVSRISQIAEQNKAAISSTEQLGKKLRDAFGFDINAPQIDFKGLEDRAKASFDRIATISGETSQRIIGQTQAITASFNTLLAPAIDSVFNALASGQNAFKALGDSLKQLVIQLVSTVVKAAALAAIISAVTGTPFNVAFKGTLSGAQQFGALGAGVAPGRIGGAGVAPGRIGGAAAPSFPRGTAFTGGGLQLAGNVTFVQRGTDLVGVLNQGNARINRVG
jgi:hypothetical protein